jgi:hypothetical protein
MAQLIINSSLSGMIDPVFVMDTLLELNDTTFFRSDYSSTPFYFLPNAPVGQSWTVSSTFPGNTYSDITITCTAITEETFLGITDSVKTYSLEAVGMQAPINDLQIQLSKQHGLIQYVPFVLFLYHPSFVGMKSFTLVGLESDGVDHGYRQPGFIDYFHLASGDILLWEIYTDPGWYDQGPPYYEYARDSITLATITPDSVIYVYDRVYTNADQSITVHPGLVGRYYRSVYTGFLDAAPNDLAIGNPLDPYYPFIWSSSLLSLTVTPDGLDTITTFSFGTQEFQLVDDYCGIYGASDVGNGLQLNTRVGLAGTWDWINPSEHHSIIIASRISGVEVGDVDMGVNELHMATVTLSIHPNPATDRIFLQDTWSGTGMTYVILDGLGREVMSGVLKEGGIAVQNLRQGLYLLHVGRNNTALSARFVKE